MVAVKNIAILFFCIILIIILYETNNSESFLVSCGTSFSKMTANCRSYNREQDCRGRWQDGRHTDGRGPLKCEWSSSKCKTGESCSEDQAVAAQAAAAAAAQAAAAAAQAAAAAKQSAKYELCKMDLSKQSEYPKWTYQGVERDCPNYEDPEEACIITQAAVLEDDEGVQLVIDNAIDEEDSNGYVHHQPLCNYRGCTDENASNYASIPQDNGTLQHVQSMCKFENPMDVCIEKGGLVYDNTCYYKYGAADNCGGISNLKKCDINSADDNNGKRLGGRYVVDGNQTIICRLIGNLDDGKCVPDVTCKLSGDLDDGKCVPDVTITPTTTQTTPAPSTPAPSPPPTTPTTFLQTPESTIQQKGIPVISFNETPEIVTINLGNAYIEQSDAVTAYQMIDDKEVDLTYKLRHSSNVNTRVAGDYQVKYWVSDDSNPPQTTVRYRSVEIIDETKPILVIHGDNPMEVNINSKYTELGVTAHDNGNVIADTDIQIDSNVDTSNAGEYSVIYTVDDGHGNVTSKTRKVIITDSNDKLCGGDSIWEEGDKCEDMPEVKCKTNEYSVSYEDTPYHCQWNQHSAQCEKGKACGTRPEIRPPSQEPWLQRLSHMFGGH